MRNWLSRVFGRGNGAPTPAPAPAAAAAVAVHTPLHGADERRPAPEAPWLGDAQVAFLLGLDDPPAAQALDDLPQDDRAFIAGIQRRLRTRELELPALPEMAIRLSHLFREGAAVTEFVTVLNRDASLSVEVLRAANSAFYAAARPVTALQDAIVRIGLNRLQAILMLAHTRGKVLKGGAFKAEADLLVELALPMGHLASRVARGHTAQPETCFMRGALMHVEHLVILGTVGAVSREVKRVVTPTTQALHQAFDRFGPDIRAAVAHEWNLTDLLLGDQGDTGTAEEYARLRRVLLCGWLRLPMPPDASPFDGLAAAMKDVRPRVPLRVGLESGPEPRMDLAS